MILVNFDHYILTIFATNKIETGAHKRYLELIMGLSHRGHKVVSISPEDFFENNIHEFIPVKLERKKNIPLTFQLAYQIFKKSELNKYKSKSKIIIFGETTALAGIVLKYKLKAPLILGVRTNIYEDRKIAISQRLRSKRNLWGRLLNQLYLSFFSLYEKFMYKIAETITVQNETDLNNVLSKSKNKPVFLIPNNINVSWIERTKLKDTNQSEYVRKIGFIGELIERKGIHLLLEAYKQLIDQGYDLELHIIGNGKMFNEIKNFKKLNSLNKIFMHGYVKKPIQLLKDLDLVVVPSLIDSFPNVIFESWYVGTPVIGSKTGGITHQLKYDDLLFEPNNSNEILLKVKTYLDKDNYKKIKNLTIERRKQFEFDWIGRYEEVIKNTICLK